MPEIENPEGIQNPASRKEIIKDIEADNEKEYLRELKKKNGEKLIPGLLEPEKERIGKYICTLFKDTDDKHNQLSDDIDTWDEVYRMKRKEVLGSDGDMPNYRSPLSMVSHEVLHANIINVFFTPSDVARVIPTEEGDISKVNKLDIFMNWSMKNELDLFTNMDRMWHYSSKTGECPYIMHWVKEYGTEIEREIIMNPANPTEPLIDEDTQEPLYIEREKTKLLYNAPKLEVFSRKDYWQASNSMMGKTPEWEGRRLRFSYDQYLRQQLQGKMYNGTIDDVFGETGNSGGENNQRIDKDGQEIPLGKWTQEFREWYGRIRVNIIKEDNEQDTVEEQELEDEYIAIVHIPTQTLCSLRVNKFPLKMRPVGLDYFIPDDEGRREGIGVYEFLDSQQKAYDALWNQFIQGVEKSNNPIGFFTPFGNQRRENIKIKNGYMYPSLDPSSIKFFTTPPPNVSINAALELIQQWAQLMFGISDFSAGGESTIDPDAPAKKVEIIVGRGNVRMNAIIKRKNQTLKDIFKRWYLLYKENMPPNKYMRVAGYSKENPWKFDNIDLEDFSLKSIPDFELTGNILNANKTSEINKKLGIYQLMIQNPLFNPQDPAAIKRILGLTKWFVEGLDEPGLAIILPEAPGDNVLTPGEENARFLQGDIGTVSQEEDDVDHIRSHTEYAQNPNTPDEIRQALVAHIQEHVKQMQTKLQQQQILAQQQQQGQGQQPQPQGGPNAGQQPGIQRPPNSSSQVVQGAPEGVAGR